jgi:outer membrane receptor protein involved in Fe transport
MKKSVLAAVTFVFLCGFCVPGAFGQAVFGSILGTVTDPSGAAVANAKVTVIDQGKGTTDQTTTNESGNYTVTHLIPDAYTVQVEATGFKKLEFKDINVSADTGSKVDGQFEVGSTSEQVEVTAESPQLKTDRADVAIEFNEKYVEDLPVLNRNFTSFELLSPGTQKLVGWSHAATENPQGGQQIFVNGQHFSGTAFELDGTDNQDPILGIIVVNPNLDAIQESKITLGNYDAEFGKAVGGVVTVQTKSGSNDFHGTATWFRRTDALAARDPFTQYPNPADPGARLIPASRWQEFAGTIGGPIIKNKLFFFADYQAQRQKSGITNEETVPTALLRSSCLTTAYCDFSDYAAQIANHGGGTNLYDPNSNPGLQTSSGGNRLAFCGSQGDVPAASCLPANQFLIPVTAMSPAALKLLAAFPNPTTSGTCAAAGSTGCLNNFIGSGAGPYNQNSFDTRIDYAMRPSINIFGRFSLDYFSLSGTPSLGAVGGVGDGPGGLSGSSNVHNYSLATGVTKTFSPTLLGDFRFGYFQYNPLTQKPDAGVAAMTNFGIPGANNPAQAQETSGLGEFDLDGTGSNFGDGLGVGRCNCPLIERERSYQWVANITKIHGNHEFKFGADLRYAQNLRVPSDSNRAGVYAFNHGATSDSGTGGLDFATFLLGDVTNLGRYYSNTLDAAERQHRMFYYAQDTWRATPKLTVNYGLRWEVYFPEYVNGTENGGFANITQGQIRVAGVGGIGLNGNIDNKWSYLAPRLGVAYQLSPRTVVRMGYGRSYDMGVFGSNFGHAVTQTLPVLGDQSAQAVNGQNFPAWSPIAPAATPLDSGPPAFSLPSVPSSGLLPLNGPACYQSATMVVGGVTVPSGQECAQAHIRPTFVRLPTLDAWNVTVQHQLNNSTSIEVAYIGNKGTHIFAGDSDTYNVNQPNIGAGTAVVQACTPVPPATTCTPSAPSFSATVPQVQRRPYYNAFTYAGIPDPTNVAIPGVASIAPGVLQCCSTDEGNYHGNDASSIYNALEVKLDKRFSHGLQVLSHYTFAHANKYDSTYYPNSHPYSYGPDQEVRNQVWVTNMVYELPFGKGKTFAGNAGRGENAILGGWQITGTSNWSGGLPWTPSFSNCGQTNDVGLCRPDKNGSFHVGAGSFDPITHQQPFFTPIPTMAYPATGLSPGLDTCTLARPSGPGFAIPACGALGNIGFDSFRGPRSFQTDAAIMKNFSITERVKAQFRMDAFNLFNHPVLGFLANQEGTGACIDCAGNGSITDIEADASPGSTTGMRQLEFALKFTF